MGKSVVDLLDDLNPVPGSQDMVRAVSDITDATHTKMEQAQKW